MAYDIVKRYERQVERSYRRYQYKVGTVITWYEFDPTASQINDPDNLYDEDDPSVNWAKYHHGFELPILSIIRDEDREGPREEGMYTGGTAHISFGFHQAVQAGMHDPSNSILHLRDRFWWDGFYWDVRRFQPSGRLHRDEVVVGVDAQKISPEELVNESDFPPSPGD